jgi:hypothetical protein
MTVLNRMFSAANEADMENPGQGIFTLLALTLQTGLKLKNDITDLC